MCYAPQAEFISLQRWVCGDSNLSDFSSCPYVAPMYAFVLRILYAFALPTGYGAGVHVLHSLISVYTTGLQ